jgi:hypothetical protein
MTSSVHFQPHQHDRALGDGKDPTKNLVAQDGNFIKMFVRDNSLRVNLYEKLKNAGDLVFKRRD